MQLHNLKKIRGKKKAKRVGRGGKRGTYSGRGLKGQKSRSGRRIRPQLRDTLKKFPKLKGYKVERFHLRRGIVNLKDLEKNFKAGEEISPPILVKRGLVRRISGKVPEVKILGDGKITKPFKIKGCLASKSVVRAVEKVGGAISAV